MERYFTLESISMSQLSKLASIANNVVIKYVMEK